MRVPEATPEKSSPATGGETLRQDAESLALAAALSGAKDAAPPELPGYEISRCLGGGAFGSVWLATEKNTGKQVAVKFYSHRRGVDWSLLNREVEKLAELYTCRDIVGLLKVGWDSDPPYYVMEFLENGSLADLLEQGPLPASEAVRIGTSVTQAVVHAHRSGILHCDLKPANVLLDRDFAPRLADFGQARLSHEQNPALGTLFYMAPEQADLNAIPDPRWDVYALGALLYHCLCGQPPYRTPENERKIQSATSLEARLAAYQAVLDASPRPRGLRQIRGVDQRLLEIVERCLEIDPLKRYPTAEEVLGALESRARHRSRRPLIWLGVVAPILLLAAMVPIALQAMNRATATAELNLANRGLESDVVTAKILAGSVEDSLEQRIARFIEMAQNPVLREVIMKMNAPDATAAVRTENQAIRDDILTSAYETEGDLLRFQHDPEDDSWFMTDEKGTQVWRAPTSKTVGSNFRRRSYFHGRGIDYEEGQEPADLKPIEAPHVSPAYVSKSTGVHRVAVSVPIWDLPAKKVIGVLGRSLALGKLLAKYQEVIRPSGEEQIDRTIVLVDVNTGEVIDHPWLTQKRLSKISEKEFDHIAISKEQQDRLFRLRDLIRNKQPIQGEDRVFHYEDPIGNQNSEDARKNYGMDWLAAFWPVAISPIDESKNHLIRETNWVALVQERRDEALRPVREVRNGLVKYFLGGLVVCCGLIATLWFFVLRALGQRPLRLRRSSKNASHTSSTISATI